MAPYGGVDFRSVVQDPEDKAYLLANPGAGPKQGKHERSKWVEYGQSKWGDAATGRWIHWAYGPSEGRSKKAVSARPIDSDAKIIGVSIHPGCIATNLAQHLTGTQTVLDYLPWLFVGRIHTHKHGELGGMLNSESYATDSRRRSFEPALGGYLSRARSAQAERRIHRSLPECGYRPTRSGRRQARRRIVAMVRGAAQEDRVRIWWKRGSSKTR